MAPLDSDSSSHLRQVSPTTISAQVARRLREQISSGAYKPGQRIPSERQLAESMGVGRPAVREALRELKAQGLLISGRGPQGTTVASLPAPQLGTPMAELIGSGAEHLLELMEIRSAVEVQAAGLAARRATIEDLRRLSHLLTPPGEITPADDDVAFHWAIAQATHNPLFRRATGDLLGLLHERMPAILEVLYMQPGGPAAIQRQHSAVLEAIRRGDEQTARDSMRRHLAYVTRGLAQLAGVSNTIRLVITNLDGALLAGPRHLSERTKKVLGTMREAGVDVVIASARAPRAIRRHYTDLGLRAPVIACNGALLWDMAADVALDRIPLAGQLASEVTYLGRELNGIVNLDSDNDWFADRMSDAVVESIRRFGIPAPKAVGTVDEVLASGEPIDKIFIDVRDLSRGQEEEARAALERALSGRANISETMAGMLDITSIEAGKATMARRLARSLGIATEEIMAVGHDDSDIGLLQWAGIGVAMGNATSATKAAADGVTSSNLRDGLAEALERWVLERP